MKKTQKNKMPLVWVVSQGCAKNLVDTEIAAGSFLSAGFGLASCEEDADIFFLNTCAFLKAAREEAAETIILAQKWKKKSPNRKIVVGGCISSWDSNGSFRKKYPFVDRWTGITEPAKLGDIFRSVLESDSEKKQLPVNDFSCKDIDAPRMLLTGGHYAYLRISDGCANRCAYCLIPAIRGPLRSRNMDSIVKEAGELLNCGVTELIVIAQDTSAYGKDLGPNAPHLPDLLKKLDSLKGHFYLRVMYLHPAGVTDDLVKAMSKLKHLVPCVEMPIQHIADPVLSAMNRHLDGAGTRAAVKRLEDAGFAIRTTFMTGFPGETDDAYQELLDYVREGHFRRLGVFAYSPEAGTPGAAMKGRPSSKIAELRQAELMKVQSKISLAYNRNLIEKIEPVFIDAVLSGGKALGRTIYDAPDIDNTVHVRECPRGLNAGEVVFVRITSAKEYDIYGEYSGVYRAGARKESR